MSPFDIGFSCQKLEAYVIKSSKFPRFGFDDIGFSCQKLHRPPVNRLLLLFGRAHLPTLCLMKQVSFQKVTGPFQIGLLYSRAHLPAQFPMNQASLINDYIGLFKIGLFCRLTSLICLLVFWWRNCSFSGRHLCGLYTQKCVLFRAMQLRPL